MQAQELKDRLKRGDPLILIDVRDSDELKAEPFFDSLPKYFLNISVLPIIFSSKQELEKQIFEALRLPESTPIVTMCHAGGRSKRACDQLVRHGWRAENLEGGILAWGEPV